VEVQVLSAAPSFAVASILRAYTRRMSSEALAKEDCANPLRMAYALQKDDIAMYYVYLIQSETFPDQRYIGYTENVEQRIKDHNKGQSTHTNKFKPWKLIAFQAFSDKEKAIKFEYYLKTGSGKAFASKRFW